MNDKHKNFYKYIIKKQIELNGNNYTFNRYEVNNYNEVDYNSNPKQINIFGIYHEQTTYITNSSSEGGSINTKISPMMLCDENYAKLIKKDDIFLLNDKKYKVIDIQNLSNCNVFFEISLEQMI